MDKEKCKWPDWLDIRPDGVHSLDPCVYATVETYKNVDVDLDKCQICGHQELSWRKPDMRDRLKRAMVLLNDVCRSQTCHDCSIMQLGKEAEAEGKTIMSADECPLDLICSERFLDFDFNGGE